MRRNLALLFASVVVATLAAEGAYRIYLAARWRAPAPAFEIYAVGESSVYGEPYGPPRAFPKLVPMFFNGEIGGREVAVHNLGRAGEALYVQSLRLERALKYRDRSLPAVVLVYSGHNERFRPRPEASLFDRGYAYLKRRLFNRSLMLEQLLCAAENRLQYKTVWSFDDYAAILRKITRDAQDAGALPILSTTIGNIRDVEPEGAQALARFRAASALEASGNFAEARREYWEAVALDSRGRFGRADAAFNDGMRAFARGAGLPLFDAVAAFEARSPHRLVGGALIADGQHPNMEGTLLLAEGFAREISRAFNAPTTRRPTAADVFRETDFGPAMQASALVQSGRWLLGVSVDHPSPRRRLDLAARRFQEALAVHRGDGQAAACLEIANSARRRGKVTLADDQNCSAAKP